MRRGSTGSALVLLSAAALGVACDGGARGARASRSLVDEPEFLAQPGAPNRRVTGRVLLAGSPADGALVTLVPLVLGDGPEMPAFRSEIQTGLDGRFDLGTHRPARYRLGASRPGAESLGRILDLRDPTTPTDGIVLSLEPCRATLRGTVRDAAGQPVPRAHVAAVFGATVADAETAADGAYHLCVPQGDGRLVVDAPGHARADVAAGAPGVRDVALAPEATLAGRLEGVLGIAIVWAVATRPVGPRPRALGRSACPEGPGSGSDDAFPEGAVAAVALAGPSGAFRLRGLGPRPLEIFAIGKDQYWRGRVEPDEDGAFSLAGLESWRLDPLSGVAVDEGGQAVPGVALGPRKESWRPEPLWTAVSQGDGRFILREPVFAPAAVRALPPHIGDGDLNARAREVKVGLAPRARGRVRFEERAVVGARIVPVGEGAKWVVSPADLPAITTADGTYDVPLAWLPLQIESDALGARSQVLQRPEPFTDLALSGAASGVVLDEAGAPLAGAEVSVGDRSTRTAPDGTFRVPGVAAGTYELQVRPCWSPPRRAIPSGGEGRFPSLRFLDDRTTHAGLHLVVAGGEGEISGRLVRATGSEPVPAVTVAAVPDDSSAAYRTAVSDAEGRFAIAALPAGRYRIEARGSLGLSVSVEAATGERDVRLHWPETGGLHVVLEGECRIGELIVELEDVRPPAPPRDGSPRCWERGDPPRERASREGSLWTFRHLRPGSYTFEARCLTAGDEEEAHEYLVAREIVTILPGTFAKLTPAAVVSDGWAPRGNVAQGR